MKNKILFFVSAIVFTHQSKLALSQAANVPSVITLYPNEIVTDSLAYSELKNYERDRAITEEFRKSFLRDGLAPNWKIIRQNELAFMEHEDFFSLLELAVTHELTYKEVENRPNLLIYPIKEHYTSSLATYKKIADENKMSWVVNFVKAEAKMIQGKRRLSVSVQLYNVVQPRLFLDKEFVVDHTMINDPDNCVEIWQCLSEHIVRLIVTDLVDKIERNIRLGR